MSTFRMAKSKQQLTDVHQGLIDFIGYVGRFKTRDTNTVVAVEVRSIRPCLVIRVYPPISDSDSFQVNLVLGIHIFGQNSVRKPRDIFSGVTFT